MNREEAQERRARSRGVVSPTQETEVLEGVRGLLKLLVTFDDKWDLADLVRRLEARWAEQSDRGAEAHSNATEGDRRMAQTLRNFAHTARQVL